MKSTWNQPKRNNTVYTPQAKQAAAEAMRNGAIAVVEVRGLRPGELPPVLPGSRLISTDPALIAFYP